MYSGGLGTGRAKHLLMSAKRRSKAGWRFGCRSRNPLASIVSPNSKATFIDFRRRARRAHQSRSSSRPRMRPKATRAGCSHERPAMELLYKRRRPSVRYNYPTFGLTISNLCVVREYCIPPMRPIISSEFRSSLPSFMCASFIWIATILPITRLPPVGAGEKSRI
jgi:hypothetical protein